MQRGKLSRQSVSVSIGIIPVAGNKVNKVIRHGTQHLDRDLYLAIYVTKYRVNSVVQ